MAGGIRRLRRPTPGAVIDAKGVHEGGVPDRKKIESWFDRLA